MKLLKTTIFILAISFSFTIHAQEAEATTQTKLDKESYYKKRAAEDAEYEQQFKAENKKEDEAFWEDQKAYEKELKQNDRKAYRAYIKGKKDAYAEHYEHCNSHCHHGDHYYSHASFYYYRYNNYHYSRYPERRATIRSNVRVNTPSLRVGLGL